MELKDLVMKNRSYRRFDTGSRIDKTAIHSWLDLARQTASARNLQSLKYAVATDAAVSRQIFRELKWAGYLPDWDPSADEQPAAYVVFCNDKDIAPATPQIDLGIQAQTLLLAATEAGYGGCIILAFNKPNVARILELPAHLDPVLVVALGLPAEQCRIVPLADNDIRYYRLPDQTHCVPKRPLTDLIINSDSED